MSLSPKALFRKPKAQPLIKAGDQARDARNWLAAADAYGRALKIKPDRADLWVQLGHAKKESGDLPGAEAAYLQSLALAPMVADTHVQLGHLRRLQKRLEDSAAHLAFCEYYFIGGNNYVKCRRKERTYCQIWRK